MKHDKYYPGRVLYDQNGPHIVGYKSYQKHRPRHSPHPLAVLFLLLYVVFLGAGCAMLAALPI